MRFIPDAHVDHQGTSYFCHGLAGNLGSNTAEVAALINFTNANYKPLKIRVRYQLKVNIDENDAVLMRRAKYGRRGKGACICRSGLEMRTDLQHKDLPSA